jgi:hypothetical protein
MAKYTRHDPQNKKRNKHKQISKQGKLHRVKAVESDQRAYNEQEYNISVSNVSR